MIVINERLYELIALVDRVCVVGGRGSKRRTEAKYVYVRRVAAGRWR